MLSKKILRKKFLLLRKKKYFRVNKSFYKPLIKLIKNKKKTKISLYYPSNYEVDTKPLFQILENNKNYVTLLPKSFKNGKMKFFKWRIFDPIEINSFGFLEPVLKKNSVNPDIIVVPIVAFDKSLNRIGYGKGYYDKFLSKLKKNKVITIGLAFFFQKYKKITTSKFDVKLDYILTEKGIYRAK